MIKSTPVIEQIIKHKYPGWEGYLNLDKKKPSQHSVQYKHTSVEVCEEFVNLLEKYRDSFILPDKKRRKIGFNGKESRFLYLNYFDFARPLKNFYKANIDPVLVENCNEAWVMKFEPGDFFDEWFALEDCFYKIYSISLLDDQVFKVNYDNIEVNSGDLAKFEARIPHEVPVVDKTTYFLNFLLMRDYSSNSSSTD